ncbi:MAG: cytochrome-c oxidase, cbb3-type subunit III, partial [Proteobacteria bacterium]|nr:cytochrome-c oxidase, cbb3-type subunit III [Pseudomonadota bacterium]
KELNTPVPKAVWIFLVLTGAFALVYWVLMPAWPLGYTYTKGLLGIDQGTQVQERLRAASMERSVWANKIARLDHAEIQADPGLMEIVRETGPALFGDNCAACHGSRGQGGPGFPSLTDSAWLWGGTPEAVEETIRVGINAPHDETRVSQMMAFGHDEILNRREVRDVVTYLRSLSVSAPDEDAQRVAAGREIFEANCTACHGEDGKGSIELGAPDLTDDFWLYGGDRQSIFTTVWNGRQGQMPAWEGRLGEVERKILTLFVLDGVGSKDKD